MRPQFRVGDWTVQPQRDQIVGPDGPVRVEPRAMQVLLCLAEHPGEVVTREEIFETVWAEKFITDEALTNAIGKLRKAFGDDPKTPRYIQTVPHKGYRLIATRTEPASRRDPDVRRALGWRWPVALLSLGVLSIVAVRARKETPPSYAPRHSAARSVPVTSDPGNEYDPSLSPDGSRVVYLMNRDVYVRNVTGGEPLRLTSTAERESSLAWTPDGQHVTFLRQTPDGYGVYSVSALGGPEAKVTKATGMSRGSVGMSWSPDGRTLAYVDRDHPDEAMAIFLLDIETGERVRFSRPAEELIGDCYPVFSPKGDRIAFVRMTTRSHFSDIYVKSLALGELERLTFDERAVLGLDWAGDGESIVFSSDRSGPAALYRIAISGGEPLALEGSEGRAYTPSISLDGSRLVYRQSLDDFNIWRAPGLRGEGAPLKLVGSTRQDRLPAYSPDGTKIAFSSDRTGHWEIWLCDSDGRNQTRLTRFDAFAAYPNWSLDGQEILFHARLDDHLDIYRIGVDSSVPVRLTRSPSNDAAPSSSRDGKWIYFNSDRSGSHQIWKMSLEDDDAVRLTENGGFGAVESHDRGFVYYSVPELAGVWRVPSSGGEEERVLTDTHGGWWTLVEGGIVFFNDSTRAFELYDFSTGRTTAFGAPAGPLWNGVSHSPDGRWFLYAQNDAPGDDIVMLENFR